MIELVAAFFFFGILSLPVLIGQWLLSLLFRWLAAEWRRANPVPTRGPGRPAAAPGTAQFR